MGYKSITALALGLGLWYSCNGKPAHYPSSQSRYPLPKEIIVKDTSLPYFTREKTIESFDAHGVPKNEKVLEKIVETDQINFSKDFNIITDRYRLVKDNDWLPSRIIGQVSSLPERLFFWDWNIHWGLDEKKSQAVLAMLEQNHDLRNLTVRINHNEAFYDWFRMMAQKDLQERNPFLFRAIVGSLTTLKDEIWSEFGRGDYGPFPSL